MNAQTKPPVRLDPIREAQAVKSLRESIAALDADDDLLADTIEGETSLFEAVDRLLSRMAENRAMVVGTDEAMADLAARKDRFVKRVEADRSLIEQAMMIAELPKLERPTATLSLSNRAPKVIVETEADIPAEFFKAPPPVLDKKSLADALKAGRDVPGAVLSNAAPSLTVRTK